MNTLTIFAFQEMEKSKAYQVGYKIGFFVGSNFWEVIITAVLILAVSLYLLFYRKRKKNIS